MDSMSINLTNPNRDVELYNLKEVTAVNYFVSNTSELHPEGIFSETIFGPPGTNDRKIMWGYVELNDVFMNPHAYYVLQRLKATIANDMKRGLGLYYVDRTGELVRLEEGERVPKDALYKESGTGFGWLRDAWPYISWKITKDMSKSAKNKRKFLKAFEIDQIFWTKYLIMPAFYRDIDFKSSKRNIINTYITKIIRLAEIIKNTDDFAFIHDPNTPSKSISHIKMQELLMEIYEFFIKKVSGADGFTNKYVVGKRTDYGARLVISPPDYNVEHFKDCEATFTHSSSPLAVSINIFSPFMIFGLVRWLNTYLSNSRYMNVFDIETKEYTQEEIDPTYMDEFSSDKIKKLLNLYKKSKIYRLNHVTIKGIDGKRLKIAVFHRPSEDGILHYVLEPPNIEDYSQNEAHYLTWCELFYIIAMDNIKDKGIYNTRYPLTTHNNTYCSKMSIIPSNNYTKAYFSGVFYPKYPIVTEIHTDLEHLFTDSMRMCSVYLPEMGADYDGDQISTQGVFTKEANQDIDNHMQEISHVLGLNGKIMRTLPTVVLHGLYGLTYRIPKP